jgi:hypothetical protein
MDFKTADVPLVSRVGGNQRSELIDSGELASRWRVPESWIRNRTRARTPRKNGFPVSGSGDTSALSGDHHGSQIGWQENGNSMSLFS